MVINGSYKTNTNLIQPSLVVLLFKTFDKQGNKDNIFI